MHTYEFERAEVVVGDGAARQRHEASRVTLRVERAAAGAPALRGVRNEFLNGRLSAEGELTEVCLPGRSLLRSGHEATLKLSAHGRWSTVRVLAMQLLDVQPCEPKQRYYRWAFLVVGQAYDPLGMFPGARDGEMLEIDGLLDLLGATRDELGGAVFDGEGGFRLAGRPRG
jgi:hypothetical protein